jgi:protein O-GlcNAc transferase
VSTSTQTVAHKLVEEGSRFRDSGDWTSAEETYRRATQADPRNPHAWAELGCLMSDSRRFAEAVDCFSKALGKSRLKTPLQDAQTTVQLLLELASARQDWARGQFSLGTAYEHLEDFASARKHLAQALQLDSSREAAVEALFARMYCLEEKWLEGIAAAERAIAAKPTYFLAHVVRRKCCLAIGDWIGSAQSTRHAVESMPHAQFHSNLLFEMNYLPDTTPETLYAEACRWNSWYAAPLAGGIRPHANTADPERRLKIGYVSNDMRAHPIAKLFIPVAERHDRRQFDIFAYSVNSATDFVTDYIKGRVDVFVPAEGPHTELAERVRADSIDILIDLAGHTTGPSYLAFALKPAPVQVAWMGVLSTTGMPAIDYFLGDAGMPCPGTEHLFTESVYRLPRSVCCYRPTDSVPVAPPPCIERGDITFGSVNNPNKIGRDVVKLWSAILHLLPGSRLLLKWHGMESAGGQFHLEEWFAEDGIPKGRLQFAGASNTTEYLKEFREIDIALDPFPYNGGTTTFDTLWMGVPIVTLSGRLPVQSIGASVLTTIGLPGLVAQTPEQYLKIALNLAAIVPKRPTLRQEIRQSLASSPFMDEAGFVRDLEEAYRKMWRTWCATKN